MQTQAWTDRDVVPHAAAVPASEDFEPAGPGDWAALGEAIAPFWMMDGTTVAPEPFQTRFKIAYNDHGLHLCIVCDEPAMSNVRAEAAEENGLIAEDDNIEIFIDPSGRGEFLHHFGYNLRGVRMQSRSDLGIAWRKPWQLRVLAEDTCWTGLVFIPWTSFDIDDRVGSTWRINVVRTRQSDGACMMSWSPTFSHNAYSPRRLGTVGPLNIDFAPYVPCGRFQVLDVTMAERDETWTFAYDIAYHGDKADQTVFSLDTAELNVLKATLADTAIQGDGTARLRVELSAAQSVMDAQPDRAREALILRAKAPSGHTADLRLCRMLRFTDLRGFQKPQGADLFITSDQLASLRRRAADDPWTRSVMQKVYDQADELIKEGFELPAEIGVWNSYYFCPKHAARLAWDRSSPHKHRCPVDDEMFTGGVYDGAWRALYHEDLFPRMRLAAVAYLVSGDMKYARIVHDILQAYARQYTRYPVWGQGGLGDLSGARVTAETIHEVGFLQCAIMAYAFTLDSDLYDAADRHRVEDTLFPEVVKVILQFSTVRTNWQVHNNLGVVLAAAWRGDRAVIDAMLNGAMGFHFHLAECVLPGGFWFEGSPGYHRGVTADLLTQCLWLGHCGLDLTTAKRIKAMVDFIAALADANDVMPIMGDTHRATLADYNHMFLLASLLWGGYPDTWIRPKDDVKDILLNHLLYYNGGEARQGAAAAWPPCSHDFVGSKVAVLGNARARVISHYDRPGPHGHQDALAIAMTYRGRHVLPDFGCVIYGHPAYPGYYRQTLAHNMVLVDQNSSMAIAGRRTLFVGEGPVQVLDMTGDRFSPGVLHRRRVLLIDDRFLVDFFTVSSDRPHSYDYVLHQDTGTLTPLNGAALKACTIDLPDAYSFLNNVRECSPQATTTFRHTTPDDDMTLIASACSPASRTFVADAPGMDGLTPASTLFFQRVQGSAARFVSVTIPDITSKDRPAVSLTVLPSDVHAGMAAAEIDLEGHRYVVLDTPAGQGHWQHVQYCGTGLCVRLDAAGNVTSLLLIHGESLSVGERTWQFSHPACVEVTAPDSDAPQCIVRQSDDAVTVTARQTSER